MQNERVVFIRYLTAHDLDFCFYDLLHISSHLLRVVVSLTINHDSMRNSFYIEHESFEITRFERRVIKYVEVFCSKSVLRPGGKGQPRCYLPNIRREHVHS